MESAPDGDVLLFEGCCFDRQTRRLLRRAATGAWLPVSLGPRALDILALLLERPGTLVSKEALMDAVWSNVAVGQNNLTVQISALRHVVDHGRTAGSCIQTIPGRGYRFAAPVLAREAEPRPAHPQTADSIASDEASETSMDGCSTATVPNDGATGRHS